MIMEVGGIQKEHSEPDEVSSDENVVFEHGGVFIHFCSPENLDDVMLGGTLKIVEKNEQNYLQWKSCERDNKKSSSEHSEDPAHTLAPSIKNDTEPLEQSVSDQEIPSEMRQPSNLPRRESDWMVVARESNVDVSTLTETSLCSVNFPKEVPNYNFTVPLDHLSVVKKSSKDVGWKYIVFELHDGASLPPLHFHQGGCNKFLKALKLFLVLTPSPDIDRLFKITVRNQEALSRSLNELQVLDSESSGFLSQNRFVSALSGFARVTNFLQDVLNPQETPPQTRPPDQRASVIQEESVEDTTPKRDDYRGEYEHLNFADLSSLVYPPRDAAMSEQFWLDHKDADGRVVKVDEVKMAIFKGGVAPELRKEVWKYLLHYYKWNMTADEIVEHRRNKEDDYYRIKMQWKSVDKDQEERFSALREHKSLIDKDVNRTDRRREFYEGEGNVTLEFMHDVLVTYVMYNFDLGYVQGMSDLLSPILEVMRSEVDAFWCFVGFMSKVEHNFDKNQHGMKQQLQDLRTILEYLDPELYDDLKEKNSNNLYFCFRWLLLRFKREFSFEDIQSLWEVMWSGLPCKNYHLLMCVALLHTERETLLHPDNELNEILKHINELTGKIELNAALSKCEGIYDQLAVSAHELPPALLLILGLNIP